MNQYWKLDVGVPREEKNLGLLSLADTAHVGTW